MLTSPHAQSKIIAVSGFDNYDEHVNIIIYLVSTDENGRPHRLRLNYGLEMRDSTSFHLFVPRNSAGYVLQILVNTSHPTFAGQVFIDVDSSLRVSLASPRNTNFTELEATVIATSPRQISFLLTNPSGRYGSTFTEFVLRKWVDDDWQYVHTLRGGFGESVAPDETRFHALVLPNLEDGLYNISARFSSSPFGRAVDFEFTIDSETHFELLNQRIFFDFVDLSLAWFHEGLLGVTQSGVISYVVRGSHRDESVTRWTSATRRTAVITAEDVGRFRATFRDFPDGIDTIEVCVHPVWHQQLASARDLRDGGYVEFELRSEHVGRQLYINVVTRNRPNTGVLTIDITRVE